MVGNFTSFEKCSNDESVSSIGRVIKILPQGGLFELTFNVNDIYVYIPQKDYVTLRGGGALRFLLLLLSRGFRLHNSLLILTTTFLP
mmetsp:Transcript_11842/g.13034  ORF Transcript_11842/g.13034 Transcript_11842/m.13034 type:complete len:87 (-) Transcript_11842:185-445(-)